jgi:hypothetical protein
MWVSTFGEDSKQQWVQDWVHFKVNLIVARNFLGHSFSIEQVSQLQLPTPFLALQVVSKQISQGFINFKFRQSYNQIIIKKNYI